MKAVHFGAGNIGRGFIGTLLSQSGHDVCFIDVNKKVVEALKERREYKVILADEKEHEQNITGVTALHSTDDHDLAVKAAANSDIITTAVGVGILPVVAPMIAEGLQKRIEAGSNDPINIIACENAVGGTTILKKEIFEHLSADEKTKVEEMTGFPDSAVDRIVPDQSHEDPLTVTVEPFYEWVVEESKMKGEIPSISGVTYVDDLSAYIERKLFTVNTGHAITAYLGYAYGKDTIKDTLDDPVILDKVEKALLETGELLIRKHNFDRDEHEKYIQKILGRFKNEKLSDKVTRVGRAPIRKLGPDDRLLAPAKQLMEFRILPKYLADGIAAALLYDYEEDEQAVELQQTIREKGIGTAIQQYTGLDDQSPLYALIMEKVEEFRNLADNSLKV